MSNPKEPMPSDLEGRGLPVPPGGEEINLGDTGPTGPSSVKSRKEPGTQVYYSHPVVPLAPPSDRIPYAVVTGLAAVFNVLVLLVIAFVLMPRIEVAVGTGDENLKVLRENQEILKANQEAGKRLTALIQDMIKKAEEERHKKEGD